MFKRKKTDVAAPPAPEVDERLTLSADISVVALPALVRMKLIANRDQGRSIKIENPTQLVCPQTYEI